MTLTEQSLKQFDSRSTRKVAGTPSAPHRLRQRGCRGLLSICLWIIPLHTTVVTASSEIPTTVIDQQAIGVRLADGKPDRQHTGVFALRTDDTLLTGDSKSSIRCSATLVAPNVLLTARHCISELPSLPVICSKAPLGRITNGRLLYVANDDVLDSSTVWHAVADIRVPKDSDMCGFDLALLILHENISTHTAIPIAPEFNLSPRPGDTLRNVGYRMVERRSLNDRTIESAGGQSRVICVGEDCGVMAVRSEFMTEDGRCAGDSGGATLSTGNRLVGILSRGSRPCATPIYTSVIAWRRFIIETTKFAAQRGHYIAPAWAQAFARPGIGRRFLRTKKNATRNPDSH